MRTKKDKDNLRVIEKEIAKAVLVCFLTFFALMLVFTLFTGCESRPHVTSIVDKTYEPAEEFFKKVFKKSGDDILIKTEQWVDEEDFVLTINSFVGLYIVYVSEETFNSSVVGATVDISDTLTYSVVDSNNHKL